jgi:peptide/nickel transport system substrate-binding protein
MTEDWGAYLEDRNVGKFPMWMLGWGSDNGDPDNYIGYHFAHTPGEARPEDCLNDETLANLLIQGREVADPAERERIYQEAEQVVHDNVYRIPVVWVTSVAVYRNNVKGYEPVVFRSWYENLWIEGE